MKSTPQHWNQEPAILALSRQLQALSLRAARMDLYGKLLRAKAMLAALERARKHS